MSGLWGAIPFGFLASGGVELVQMFTGLRFAASQTFGSGVDDLSDTAMLGYPSVGISVTLDAPSHR